MSDEEILTALRQRARAQRRESDRIEELARREAQSESPTKEEQLARPLDAAAEARIANAILSRARSHHQTNDTRARSASLKPAPPSVAKVRSLAIGWRVCAFLAAAAIVALFFGWPKTRELPPFALELSGDVSSNRADGPRITTATVRLHRETSLSILLRPETPILSPIEARTILVRNGTPHSWAPTIEISPEGTIRITGPVQTLFPDLDAPWEIILLVGTNADLPDSPQAILNESQHPKTSLRVTRAKIEFVDR